MLQKRILIYKDAGAGPRSCSLLAKALEEEFSRHPFDWIDSKKIVETSWEKECLLLIMPGGRDLPYQMKLQGKGNLRIQNFVQNGGKYLGICAGGYYGAKQVEFEKGLPLEVLGERELAFFPGVAKGSHLNPGCFDYASEKGALVASLTAFGKPSFAYFNGGCQFLNAEHFPNTTVLATYNDSHQAAAVIECKSGLGKAILSGVHPEYSGRHLKGLDSCLEPLAEKLILHDKSRKELFINLLERIIYD